MKKYISFSCLLLLTFGACSAFRNKPVIDLSNLSGIYTHEHAVEMPELGDWGHGTETAKLTLNPDSTFHLDIEFAFSDFPGEYDGNWKLNKAEIILMDTTGVSNDKLRFSVNENGSLTGKYGASEQTFNRNTK
jgi:hypothetical protein